MPLTVTLTAAHTFPAGQPVTLAALRKAAGPSISLTGSVATGDIVDGAITPAKVSPGAYFYGNATLAGAVYFMNGLTPALTGLAAGALIRFKASAVNPAGVGLNVSGLGIKPIKKGKGIDLALGDIRADQECEVSYDAINGNWQLLTPAANLPDRYGAESGTANAYVLTHNGTTQQTVTALGAIHGVPLRFKAGFTNTGAATLAVDGLAAKAIRWWDDQALPNGYIKVNQIVEVIYDSVLDHFVISNPAKDTAIGGALRNLVLKATAANGTDDDLTVTADDVVVKDAAGNAYAVGAVNKVLNPSAAGAANAFDTGAPASGNWYYVWVIWDGTTVAVLGSASATAPTLPANYTHKALVGEWYYETTTNPRGKIGYGERKRFDFTGTGGLPASDVTVDFTHRLGAVPTETMMRLVCITTDGGFAVGDEVVMGWCRTADAGVPWSIYQDATKVTVIMPSILGTTIRVPTKGTPAAMTTLTAAKWNLRVIAST